jgi:hypothetical protein
VSRLLRERFVLHWKSVRPVPIVTIDMGDGRILRRTITGNSIHYILDQDGRVLDALPGLLGPRAFTQAIYATSGIGLFSKFAGEKSHPPTAGELATWHGAEADNLCQEWLLDALQAGAYGPAYRNVPRDELNMGAFLHQAFPEQYPADYFAVMPRARRPVFYPPAPSPTLPSSGPAPTSDRPRATHPPSATAAALRAASKGGPEKPILKRIMPPDDEASSDANVRGAGHAANPTLVQRMDSNLWSKIAEQHHWDAVLDPASRRLMISKMPPASVSVAERASGFPEFSSDAFGKTLERFQQSMAEDTVRNQYLFHIQIHRWLAKDEDGALSHDVDALNKKVYAELFLTPDDDPWLGLMPDNTYTALEKDGCVLGKGN